MLLAAGDAIIGQSRQSPGYLEAGVDGEYLSD